MKKTNAYSFMLMGFLGMLLSTASSAQELRATLMPTCPTTDYPKPQEKEFAGALASLLASTLINTAVDTGLKAFVSLTNPENTPVSRRFIFNGLYERVALQDANDATKTVNVASLNSKHECLVVAVGKFEKGPDIEPWHFPFKVDAARQASVQGTLMTEFGMASVPIFYFEAARIVSMDKSAVSWRPVRVFVSDYLNNSFFAGRERGIALTINLINKSGATFGTQSYLFDPVMKPYLRNDTDLNTGITPAGTWIALPAQSQAKDAENLVPPQGVDRLEFDPFTLSVELTESPKPYKLAKAYAEALSKQSTEISTQLQEALLPSKGKPAEQSRRSTTLTDLHNYLEKLEKTDSPCAADKVSTPLGASKCALAIEDARLARDKAQLSCGIASVPACDTMPALPQTPS